MAIEENTIAEAEVSLEEEKTGLKEKLKNVLRRLRPRSGDSLKESLEELIEEHEDDGEKIAPEERRMLSNILAFGDLRVDEVMTPRAYIVAVEEKITIEEFKKFVIDKQHTRFPVFRRNLDEVKGFIHIKDLFPYLGGDNIFDIKEILRPLLFVPPSMQIIDLLAKMRVSHVHIALVIDEYGGTSGLVTMEDLMEKIVGEIRDEHDESENQYEFLQVGSFAFEASGAMPIEMLEDKIGIKISSDEEKEDFDTVGGMIFTALGRVPQKDEMINHSSGLVFEIVEADARKIKKVLIRKTIPDKNLEV